MKRVSWREWSNKGFNFEASWRVMKEHLKDLKVWREELRTIAGSRTRKAEISGDLEEGVIRGKLCRE